MLKAIVRDHHDLVVQKVSGTISAASGVATASAGGWAFLGDNATAITALMAITGGLISFCSFLVFWYYHHKGHKREERLESMVPERRAENEESL